MDYEPKSDELDGSRPQAKSARVEPKLEPTWRPRTAMDSDGESAHRSDFAANAAACRQYGGTTKADLPLADHAVEPTAKTDDSQI